MTSTPRTPDDLSPASYQWRDARLGTALKELHKLCSPDAREAFKKVTARLRKIDKILVDWDAHHERLTLAHIAGNRMESASLAAFMIWDEELKLQLLRKIDHSGAAREAAERTQLAEEMDRQVLT